MTRHVETSVNYKEVLDKCQSILDLSLWKVLLWCGTSMAYFLDAWEIFSKIVPAIHDVIFIQNIKEGTQ